MGGVPSGRGPPARREGAALAWPSEVPPDSEGARGRPSRSLLVACSCWLAGKALRYWRIQPGPTESRTSTAPDLARRQQGAPQAASRDRPGYASDKLAPQVLDSHIVGLRVDLARATVGLRVSLALGGRHGRGTARLCRAPGHAAFELHGSIVVYANAHAARKAGAALVDRRAARRGGAGGSRSGVGAVCARGRPAPPRPLALQPTRLDVAG